MTKKIFTLLMMACLAGAQPGAANLLTNGSFEDGLLPDPLGGFQGLPAGSTAMTGWTVVSGNVDWIGTGFWEATDGGRSVDMNGSTMGAIEQSFATATGQTYEVSFELAGNPACGQKEKHLRVSVAGVSQDYTFDTTGKLWPGDAFNLGYAAQSFSFVATGAHATLAFASVDQIGDLRCGPVIDNASVVATNQAPDLTDAAPSIASLWPPNNKMVDITIEGVTDPDGDALTITIDSISDDEGSDPDDAVPNGSTASLRAQRDGAGDGRTYTIEFTVDDGNGGIVSSSVTVEVPHDQGKGKKKGRGKAVAIEATSWGAIKQSLK